MNRSPKPNLLVVDDEPDLLELVRRVASRSGDFARVDTYASPEQALAALSAASGRELPNLVLVDHRMPRLSGFEFAMALRESPKLRDIPVIMTSNAESAEERERALRAGCRAFLLKPVGLQALFSMLKEALYFSSIPPAPAAAD